MQLKPVVTAVALMIGMSMAQAAEIDFGPAKIVFDDSTSFGGISSWYSSSSGYGFSWTVPSSVTVSSSGSLSTAPFALPSFTLSANAGWTLDGAFSAFFGNLSFLEYGGATTGILAYADVSVNGGPATSFTGGVGWTATPSGVPGLLLGYFSDSTSISLGSYNSVTISNASIVLSATGGVLSAITTNPQAKLEFSFNAVPVPEPGTYAMLMSGLGLVGWIARRRRQS